MKTPERSLAWPYRRGYVFCASQRSSHGVQAVPEGHGTVLTADEARQLAGAHMNDDIEAALRVGCHVCDALPHQWCHSVDGVS